MQETGAGLDIGRVTACPTDAPLGGDPVRRIPDRVSQPLVNVDRSPLVARLVLDPLVVGDDDAAGVGEDVGDDVNTAGFESLGLRRSPGRWRPPG